MNYSNFINGKSLPSVTGKEFEKRNPADHRELLGLFPRSGKEDIDLAVNAAKDAFASWSSIPAPERARILFRVGQLIETKKQDLASYIVKEMGKTTKEALGEVQSAADMAMFIAGEGRRLFGTTTPSGLPHRYAETRRTPIGVCGLITPWNAPIASIIWKLAPALVCGNTVVIKPSEDTPGTANLLMEILNEAQLPPGVAHLVHGIGEEAGDALVRHPEVKLISFTGSTKTGKLIHEICASRSARTALEMGGKNGSLVLDDADLEHATNCIIAGAFSMAGQRCASTSRVIVQESIADNLIERLLERTKKLQLGPGSDTETEACPVINQTQFEHILAAIRLGQEQGANLRCGGKKPDGERYKNGWFIEPTIFTDVDPHSQLAQEEIFGPVLSIMSCKDLDHGIELMNNTSYGLTAAVHTTSISRGLTAVDRIRAGVVYLNAATFGSEVHLPFGGYGISGNGHREAGLGGIHTFSEEKTIYFDFSQRIQHAQMTPPKTS